jgi:inorganic triphosphatase YgiF
VHADGGIVIMLTWRSVLNGCKSPPLEGADMLKGVSMEIELKFALLPHTPAALARSLARVPVLAHQKAARSRLHNAYFDTPDQLLRRNRTALRVRRMGDEAAPSWVQTLKIGQGGASALSERGEWECAVQDGTLDFAQLRDTPWALFDPDGAIAAQLVPQFVVAFERTTWTVDMGAGSRVEVALDIGTVAAGAVSAPVCELELELVSGQRQALFDVARLISASLSLMPLHWSKSERGYQLVQGSLNTPLRTQPAELTQAMSLPQLAAATLQEMFLQFTANLNHLRASDDPEVLHQARVGWRRFKSLSKLFSKHAGLREAPPRAPLQPLLQAMTALRDLEVAGAETLPMFANAYTAGVAQRRQRWRAREQALAKAVDSERKTVLKALESRAIGTALVDVMCWLELQLPHADPLKGSLRASRSAEWLLQRVTRMHERLAREPVNTSDPKVQHRIRILSKRLRYCVEALRPLLPKGRSKRWLKLAISLQEHIGAARDIANAVDIVTRLSVDEGIVEFLRGVAFGERMHAR